MIIYKIQERGEATDFMFARSCPTGCKSIPGDRIPEDISIYHEQKYIDSELLRKQKQTCIKLLNESEKAVSSDPPYPADEAKWKTFRAKIRVILKSDELKEIPKKPF